MLRRGFLASVGAAIAGACWPWRKAQEEVTVRLSGVYLLQDGRKIRLSSDDYKCVVIWNGHAQYWEFRRIECPTC